MPDEGEAAIGRDRPANDRSAWIVLRRWVLTAIVVCLGLGVLGIVLQSSSIAADLSARVSARLVETGQTWASARIDGRDVVLMGTAPALVRQEEARAAVADVWGVAAVRDETSLIPLIVPFQWAVARSEQAFVLTGYVPSDETRAEVMDLVAAAFPTAAIDDRTELGRGAPDDFLDGVSFALRIVGNLARGVVSLGGTAITATGLAADTPRYESALAILSTGIPSGYFIADAAVDPPFVVPYVWSLVFDGTRAEVSGYVPDTATAAALAAATAESLGGLPTDNRTILASGEPEGFAAFVSYALGVVARLGSGVVTLTASQLEISGRAKTPEDYAALQAAAAEALPPGLVLIASEIQPSMAEAYVLEVVRTSGGVRLIGFMPSDNAHAEVLAEAARLFGANEIDDELQIADGAPRMDWIGAAKFALGQVAGLEGGSARISDHSYSITGAAATPEAYEELLSALQRTLPASLVLNTSLLSAPVASPFRFVAAVGPETVTLTGFAPTPEIRAALVAAADVRFTPRVVTSEMLLAEGAPAGFEEAVNAGLQAISRLDSGRVEIVDRAVTVSGVAPYAGAVSRIEDQLRATLPPGYTLATAIPVKPAESRVTPAVCQELLTAELGEGTVKFTEGSVAIAPESEGRLDRLVAILERCPEARVEIGGHTDSGGTVERNRTLSQLRAESVVEYLVAAGVNRDRLGAVGYGEANPITTNETEEGRAQNRRIEFRVLEL